MKKVGRGDLRVWWIPQVPMQPFYAPVKDIKEAKNMLNLLGRYDLFQFENNIKPDYCNAGGLEVAVSSGEWHEWENEDGEDINDIELEM